MYDSQDYLALDINFLTLLCFPCPTLPMSVTLSNYVVVCPVSSAKGSDCGIVNINIPTSGAEIGGAFGLYPSLHIS